MVRGATGRAAAMLAACGTLATPALADPVEDGGFRAMVERPLFSPSRRPPPVASLPEAPVPLAPLPPPRPDVALSGVIAGGGGGIALLKRPLDPAPVRVALGGRIDGWTLAEIRPRSVVLRREALSVTVDLPAAAR